MPSDLNSETTRESSIFSPAGMGRAHLRIAGVRSRLAIQPEFPREILAYATSAFLGGLATCGIRLVPVPVVHVDFLSEYPLAAVLMGLWEYDICARIETRDATLRVRAFLAGVMLDHLYDRGLWPSFVTLVQLRPDGDYLPHRARFGPRGNRSWNISVGLVRVPEALLRAIGVEGYWYFLPDVIRAKLATVRAPQVERAIQFVPQGLQPGLRPTHLRGVPFDPVRDDLYRLMVEQRARDKRDPALSDTERARRRQFLKIANNSLAFGVRAQLDVQELPQDARDEIDVWSLWETPHRTRVSHPEEPGPYFFAPLAGVTTAAGRLLLGMLQTEVERRGGAFAFVDTDSMAIVATQEGRPLTIAGRGADGRPCETIVRALASSEVDDIVAGFARLNPFDHEAVPGSILKIEDVNFDPETGARRQLWCYAISAKRYTFLTYDEHGEPQIAPHADRTWREHGLGHLMNPLDPQDHGWMKEFWSSILAEAHGKSGADPSWARLPAVSRVTASSAAVLKAFERYNETRPPHQRVGPFDFLMAVHVNPLGIPVDHADCPDEFTLISPFNTDARQWLKVTWVCKHCGKGYRITTRSAGYAGLVPVKSYGDVLAEYRTHPEYKMNGPDGLPCTRLTAGVLSPRAVLAARPPFLIGKEAHRIEDAQTGVEQDPDALQNTYPEPRLDAWPTLIRPVLRSISPRSQIAQATGVDLRTVRRWLWDDETPEPMRMSALRTLAGGYSREALLSRGLAAPEDDVAVCAAFLALDEGRRCEGCGGPIKVADLRARHCSGRCKSRVWRTRSKASAHDVAPQGASPASRSK